MRGKVREEQTESRRPPRDPSQRRFDRIFAVTFIAAMAILATVLGVILPRLREGRQPSPNGTSKQALKAEVERAYLAYWDAIEEAYLKLDASLLEKVMTPGALEVERKAIDRERQGGTPRREVVTKHNYQIVIYRGGDVASVDDVYELERAHLDPQTLKPVEPEAKLVFHGSFIMRSIDGMWKLDDEVLFGTGRPTPQTDISQAAVSIENPIPQRLQTEIENAYLAYLAARVEAYRNLDPAPLEKVLTGEALDSALLFLNERHQRNEQFIVDVEHNYRVAVDGEELAYMYDTVADRSVLLHRVTRKPVEPAQTDIFRYSYTLRKVEGRWKVDLVKQHE